MTNSMWSRNLISSSFHSLSYMCNAIRGTYLLRQLLYRDSYPTWTWTVVECNFYFCHTSPFYVQSVIYTMQFSLGCCYESWPSAYEPKSYKCQYVYIGDSPTICAIYSRKKTQFHLHWLTTLIMYYKQSCLDNCTCTCMGASYVRTNYNVSSSDCVVKKAHIT